MSSCTASGTRCCEHDVLAAQWSSYIFIEDRDLIMLKVFDYTSRTSHMPSRIVTLIMKRRMVAVFCYSIASVSLPRKVYQQGLRQQQHQHQHQHHAHRSVFGYTDDTTATTRPALVAGGCCAEEARCYAAEQGGGRS